MTFPPLRGEAPDREREQQRRAEAAERRGEAQPVGQHEPGKRRRGGRVGGERETAQHDPAAERAGQHGQQQQLEERALDEGELERLEHGRCRA